MIGGNAMCVMEMKSKVLLARELSTFVTCISVVISHKEIKTEIPHSTFLAFLNCYSLFVKLRTKFAYQSEDNQMLQ